MAYRVSCYTHSPHLNIPRSFNEMGPRHRGTEGRREGGKEKGERERRRGREEGGSEGESMCNVYPLCLSR